MAPRRHARQSSPAEEDARAAETSQCDIYSTTFSLHRVSPLFVGTEPLSEERLQRLALRLREALVGDVVRGVEVGLDGGSEATAMGSAGALEAVLVEWTGLDAVYGTPQKALQIALQYENSVCLAILLPGPDAAVDEDGSQFLHLPLLLLRMPTPLKSVVADFLAGTFDCRVASVRLQPQDLVRSWEAWARATRLPTAGPLAKDAVLTLGFRLPGSKQAHAAVDSGIAPETNTDDVLGIKSMDIVVADRDLSRFLKAGQRLVENGQANGRQPFMSALAQYVEHHLALDMSNPAVRVVRIACGGFVLGESRIKIFSVSGSGPGDHARRQQLAVRGLIADLATRAKGAT